MNTKIAQIIHVNPTSANVEKSGTGIHRALDVEKSGTGIGRPAEVEKSGTGIGRGLMLGLVLMLTCLSMPVLAGSAAFQQLENGQGMFSADVGGVNLFGLAAGHSGYYLAELHSHGYAGRSSGGCSALSAEGHGSGGDGTSSEGHGSGGDGTSSEGHGSGGDGTSSEGHGSGGSDGTSSEGHGSGGDDGSSVDLPWGYAEIAIGRSGRWADVVIHRYGCRGSVEFATLAGVPVL